MTFKHAGDLGDVIYSLPVIRALGGGTLCLHTERWTREPMNEAKVRSLRTLLEGQPYIKDVRWLEPDETADVNLNDFRAPYFKNFSTPEFPTRRSLCEWMLLTHCLHPDEQVKQWLSVVPRGLARVIINRTGRYQNPKFPWDKVLKKYWDDIAFVGTRLEHGAFTNEFGQVPFIYTDSLLDLAQLIAGADLFIGGQSCPYAIAEGLKKPAVLEVCTWLPNCLFTRADCIHGWGEDVELPEIRTKCCAEVCPENAS